MMRNPSMKPAITCDPAQQRSAQSQQKPFPGMRAFADKILRHDIFAAGRDNRSQPLGKFRQRVAETRPCC